MSGELYVYLAVWSGGFEVPQYRASRDCGKLLETARRWRSNAKDEDAIDVLRINVLTGGIEFLQSLTGLVVWSE